MRARTLALAAVTLSLTAPLAAQQNDRPSPDERPNDRLSIADYLEWEREDYREAVEGIRQGHEDVKAGRTRSADQFLDEFARKHGLPR